MAEGKNAYWLTGGGACPAPGLGISRSTLSEWKKHCSDISDALKQGKDVADRQVENALYQ
ncbi:MAG: DNA-packaging protein [Acidaminococcales bacterium]|nr:DNA-packaging protein [Acidaminococcales bacterium]